MDILHIFRIVPRYKYDAHTALNEMLERLSRNRSSIGVNVGTDDYEEQGNITTNTSKIYSVLQLFILLGLK